jgi:hypothetical protein
MSQLLTVSDIKASRIPTVLGICPDDARLLQWLNEAEDAMLNQGRWWGSIREAQFCVDNGCLVWPREVATIEQVAICGQPMDYQNAWYAYTRNLATLNPCDECGNSCSCTTGSTCTTAGCACGHLQMREKAGFAVSFASVIGENKVLRVYPTHPSDVGKTIIFQGYDENGIWVRTLVGGSWIDGEQVTLALPFADTTTVWQAGAPLGVLKDATVQRVLVYSYDTVTDSERLLAIYQPSETRPMYRWAWIPNFNNIKCCNCDEDDRRTVTAIVSLQHIPLAHDNDFVIFQNLNAYKMAMQAVKLWESPATYELGNFYFYGTQQASRNARGVERVVNRGAAIPLLVAELRKMTSDRVNAFIRLDETKRPMLDMAGFR